MKCQATCFCALVLPQPALPFTKLCVISSLPASKYTASYRYHEESRVRKRPLLMTSQAVDIFSVGHRDPPEPSLPRDSLHAAKQSDTGAPVYNPSDLGLHLKIGSKVITPYGFLFSMQAWLSAAIMFPCCLLAAVLSAVFDWRRMRLPTIVALWWGRRVMLNMGIRPMVEGAELLPPPEEPVVFVANHGSYLDIPVTNFLPRLCKYLMKAELLWLPIVGWKAVVSKDIFVHRQTSATFRRLISTSTRSLKSGNSILAFPEGTRSRNGRLGKFKRGPFTMAQKAGVRIVPVSITGVVNAMPPFALAPLVKPRDAKLVIHRPISTKGRSIKEVIAEARRAVGDALEDWQKPLELTSPTEPPSTTSR